jgi:SAM-dependent methyltransferase
MTRLDAPATARNREPILAVLTRWLADASAEGAPSGASSADVPRPPTRVLEIASGTGQHAVHFAEALPQLRWQPSDPDPDHLASIEAWRATSRVGRVDAPLRLDVRKDAWPAGPFDAVFNANMIHIAPWPVAEAFFAGAGRVLADGGLLFLYGPFRVGGRHTAPSNEAFDADLRRRNSEWGVRDLERVVALAGGSGLALLEDNALPANNRLLVFRRAPRGASAD